MDLHETDYIMYYNVHRVRFTFDLFHKIYFLKYHRNEGVSSSREDEILTDMMSDEERKKYNSVLLHGVFLVRMYGLQHLGTKAECAGWFKPEMRPMINDRHPYIAAAAVEPMDYELIGGSPDLAFDPDSFRLRVKEIETLWGIAPDIERSAC